MKYLYCFLPLFLLACKQAETEQDSHNTNYYGSRETGKFLHDLMYPGASVDWKTHLQEHLGSEMNAKPMLEYFAPLMNYLKQQNADRVHSLPERL